MTYNSQREHMDMPEYGRNVHNLIQHAKTIGDDKERQDFMNRVVELMLQMNPQSRNLMEYREKLWRHAFRIANYDINVVPPNGIIPTLEAEKKKTVATVPYPKELRGFRHYGKNVRTMIENAIALEDEEKKKAYTLVIGAYMKLAYQTWNQDHFINDKMVRDDLTTLSSGKLVIDEEESLNSLISSVVIKPKRNYRNNQKGGSRNHKGKSNNRYKKRR